MLIAVVLLVASACAAPLEDPERFTGEATAGGCPEGVNVETDVLAVRCAGAACHSASEMPGGGLDLLSDGAVERVAGVESPSCAGEVLAIPGDPDGSLIVRKLADDPPCGARMPLVGALDGDEEACLREWIETMPGGE